MTAFRADLAALDTLVDRLAAFERRAESLTDQIDSGVARLPGDWTGCAAAEHQAAHRQWADGAASLRSAAAALRTLVATAHGNYTSSGATKRADVELIAVSLLLDVHPSAYTDAARVIGNEVAECTNLAWLGLQRALTDTGGMAGTDDAGTAWGAAYDRAASAATATTQDVINACYQLAALLEQSGINWARAEAASVPGGVAESQGNRWAAASVSLGDLDTAVGFGVPSPMGWSLLQHAIGYLWPDGHQDRLHAAAAAWSRAGDQILSVLGDLDNVTVELLFQRAPEIHNAVAVVDAMRGYLADLAATYFRIGASCDDYAHHLDDAHHRILDELRSFLEASAIIEAAGGLLSVITLGASELLAQGGEGAEIARAAAAIRSIIQALVAAASSVRAAVEAARVEVVAISDRVAPILARRVEAVQLAHATDRGELIIGQKLGVQRDAVVASTPEGVALQDLEVSADVGPASDTWSDPRTLFATFR